MPDQKPPRLAAGERDTLVALLQFQRDSFLRKTDGLDDDAATWSPLATGTSLLWLANHLADAERTWVLHRLAGRRPQDDPRPAQGVAAARDRYRETWAVTDAVLAEFGLDDPCPAFDDGPLVTVRWILGHLLEETARHAGHADVLRELLDETTGR